jgi:uncharacterized iron-regulated membrane protein
MAEAIPVDRYYETLSNLTAARTAINQGETALDKSWAESEVANAQGPINNTDAVITWFKGNLSTAGDPTLDQIIAKRDSAANYITAANNEIHDGNYSAARENAQEAYEMGNESYSDALSRQNTIFYEVPAPCLGCGLIGSKLVLFTAGIGVFVLLIAGIIMWKKKPQR